MASYAIRRQRMKSKGRETTIVRAKSDLGAGEPPGYDRKGTAPKEPGKPRETSGDVRRMI